MTRPTIEQSEQYCCPIVELRQYTLHPGKRDHLIDLFDRNFIESQEAAGARIIGQFRDLDNPNRFVWLRGFRDMPSRAKALQDFYDGPIWKARREEANATMVDSDNVLLLHPALPNSGFALGRRRRAPIGASELPNKLVIATIYYFDAPADNDLVNLFVHTIAPIWTAAGALILAHFVTENSVNDFPLLPVREGEQVLVCFTSFANNDAYERHIIVLSRSHEWRHEIFDELTRRFKKAPEVLKLSPTARSLLYR